MLCFPSMFRERYIELTSIFQHVPTSVPCSSARTKERLKNHTCPATRIHPPRYGYGFSFVYTKSAWERVPFPDTEWSEDGAARLGGVGTVNKTGPVTCPDTTHGTAIGLPIYTLTPQTHHPWPFLDTPMAAPWVVFGAPVSGWAPRRRAPRSFGANGGSVTPAREVILGGGQNGGPVCLLDWSQ